jgi:hypothetical protein
VLGFNDITYKFIIHVYTMDMYLGKNLLKSLYGCKDMGTKEDQM